MKETIMMLHGMWGSGRVWECFKKYFELAGYSCIAPALRFHDMKSDPQPDAALGHTSLLDYAQDLQDAIHKLSTKPIIMGHSMGGLLTQMLAERGLAKAVVLLAPSPPAGLVVFNMSSARSLLSEISTPGFWNKPVRVSPREAAYGLLNRCSDELRTQLYDQFVFESGRALFETVFWYFDRRKASAVDQQKVKCPIMIVVGKEDRNIPVVIARRIAKKYPTVSLYAELENHAHWLIEEPGWEDVARLVKEWLERPNDSSEMGTADVQRLNQKGMVITDRCS